MKTVLSVMIALVVSACLPSVDEDQKSVVTDPVTAPDQARWFVGQWDCPLMDYSKVPPYLFHRVSSIMRFVENPLTGAVHGEYQETVDPGNPGFEPVNWSADFTFGQENVEGTAPVSAIISNTDGSTIDASGTSHGRFKFCTNCILGVLNLTSGGIRFADGTVRGWSGGLFGSTDDAGAEHVSVNWLIQISTFSNQVYFATETLCNRHVD